MPKAKKYPGIRVRNRRWGNRIQHLLKYDGKPAVYYRSGMWCGIYSDTFDIFIGILAKRIRNHQQNVIIANGDTGSGKSTLIIEMCYELAKKLNVPFDLKIDYIYSVDDLWNKIQNPNASPISLIDEAALVLNSKRSQSNDSLDVVNLFNTMRSRGWTTFLVCPNLYQINKDVRITHVDYTIYCSSEDDSFLPGFGRGMFELSKAKRSRFAKKNGGEPYYTLKSTGVFKELPKKIDEVYQPIKSMAQDKLIINIAEKRKKKGETA